MKSKIFKYIYAMLCLLPAIAVGVTCVYVANNDNAYLNNSFANQSVNTITDFANFESGKRYQFNGAPSYLSTANTGAVYNNYIELTDISIVSAPSQYVESISGANRFSIYKTNGNTSGSFFFEVEGVNVSFSTSQTLVFDFTFISGKTTEGYSTLNELSTSVMFTTLAFDNSLDNVFYYSLDKVENSSVFSWVKSNFLYSGVNQFVGIFGGTNSNISFYLTWVLTISLCYLGFEVLMLFINMARNLIHSFTDKDRW